MEFRIQSVLHLGKDTHTRKERWRYLVRDLGEQGAFTLEASLVDLTATIDHGERDRTDATVQATVRRERSRLQERPARLKLSLDGLVDELEVGSWSDGLVHRLLALRLAPQPVSPGDEWSDPAAARPFENLLPAMIPTRVTGAQRFIEIRASREGPEKRRRLVRGPIHMVAVIQTSAAVLPEDARFPGLDVEGITEWNLADGAMDHRVLHVRERAGNIPGEPASFELEGWRVAPLD